MGASKLTDAQKAVSVETQEENCPFVIEIKSAKANHIEEAADWVVSSGAHDRSGNEGEA